MLNDQPYQTKSFNLRGLQGISDKTIDLHLAGSRHGCVGTRISPRLHTHSARAVHRRVLFQHQLAGC